MHAVNFDASTTRTATVLIATATSATWLQAVRGDYNVTVIDRAEQIADALFEIPYQLMILDDELVIDEDTFQLIAEIKRRFPSLVLCILTDNLADEYIDRLLDTGASDVLPIDVDDETLLRHLRVLQRQQSESQQVADHMQQMHLIGLMARELHGTEHPETLVLETIKILCNNFNLSGVVIAIEEGDRHHIYAGDPGTTDLHEVFDSYVTLHNYDPLNQVLISGSARVLNALERTPFYAPVPPLQTAQSAIVVPLTYADRPLGALALLQDDTGFSKEDLVPFELFAGHLALAYHNISYYHLQEARSRSTRQVLKAWQRLSGHFELDTVLKEMLAMMGEIPAVKHAGLWLFDSHTDDQRVITRATRPVLADEIQTLYNNGHLQDFLSDTRLSPTPLVIGRRTRDPLQKLSQLMENNQLLLVPIAGAMMMGTLIVSSTGKHAFSVEETSLIEGLAHAASQTIERNTFIEEIQLQAGRMNAIVSSIHDGVFFIGDNDLVVYCNPQFAELTSIEPTEVVGQPADVLFGKLADKATTERGDILNAVQNALDDLQAGEYYPIVEMHLDTLNTDIAVEFTRVEQQSDSSTSRVGLVRRIKDNQPAPETASHRPHEPLLDMLVDYINLPYLQMRESVTTLAANHERLRGFSRARLIQQLASRVDEAGTLWTHFMQLYDLRRQSETIVHEVFQPHEALNSTLTESADLRQMERPIDYHAQPPYSTIRTDERLFQQAISNLLAGTAHLNPDGDVIDVQVTRENETCQILIRDRDSVPEYLNLPDMLAQMQRHSADIDDSSLDYLHFFLAAETIEALGGDLTLDVHPVSGLQIQIRFAVAESNLDVPAAMSSASRQRESNGSSVSTNTPSSLRIAVLETASRLLSPHYGYLQTEGHSIMSERSVRDILMTMSAARLDLIVLESDNPSPRLAEACERIRAESEVPVIIVADHDTRPLFMEAIEKGADAFLVLPVSPREMALHFKTFARRREIGMVLQPPLQLGDLYLDFSRRRVFLKNTQLDLTAKEYAILCELGKREGQVLSHQELLSKVWGTEYRDEVQYLWVNVSRLRKKLEPEKDSPRYLQTEKGVGYRLCDPNED